MQRRSRTASPQNWEPPTYSKTLLCALARNYRFIGWWKQETQHTKSESYAPMNESTNLIQMKWGTSTQRDLTLALDHVRELEVKPVRSLWHHIRYPTIWKSTASPDISCIASPQCPWGAASASPCISSYMHQRYRPFGVS